MLIFYFQFITVHITASCCLEQTSTVLTTANRPDNTIPSSVPFSCWRAHTALPLRSPLARLNWSSLYHHLVHKHISDDSKHIRKEHFHVIILAAAYISVSCIRIFRENVESRTDGCMAGLHYSSSTDTSFALQAY